MNKTYEERLADLAKKYEEDRATLQAESELAAVLPAIPKSIHFANKPEPWISYEVATLADALGLIKQFPAPLNVSGVEDGCFDVKPVGYHEERYEKKAPRWIVNDCIQIAQHEYGQGHYHDMTVIFWYALGAKCIRVCITVKQRWKYASYVNAFYNSDGSVHSARLVECKTPLITEDARVKFDAGSRDGMHLIYFYTLAKFERVVEL
jgi:hypothetical protein